MSSSVRKFSLLIQKNIKYLLSNHELLTLFEFLESICFPRNIIHSLTIFMPWPVWLSWLEYSPINQKVMDPIPSQGQRTYLGWGFGPRWGWVQEAADQCFSLTWMFLSLPISLLSPLSKINGHVLEWEENIYNLWNMYGIFVLALLAWVRSDEAWYRSTEKVTTRCFIVSVCCCYCSNTPSSLGRNSTAPLREIPGFSHEAQGGWLWASVFFFEKGNVGQGRKAQDWLTWIMMAGLWSRGVVTCGLVPGTEAIKIHV